MSSDDMHAGSLLVARLKKTREEKKVREKRVLQKTARLREELVKVPVSAARLKKSSNMQNGILLGTSNMHGWYSGTRYISPLL